MRFSLICRDFRLFCFNVWQASLFHLFPLFITACFPLLGLLPKLVFIFESGDRKFPWLTLRSLTLASVPQGPATGMSFGSVIGNRGGDEQHAARITVGVWTSIFFHFVQFGFLGVKFWSFFLWCWRDRQAAPMLFQKYLQCRVCGHLLFLSLDYFLMDTWNSLNECDWFIYPVIK